MAAPIPSRLMALLLLGLAALALMVTPAAAGNWVVGNYQQCGGAGGSCHAHQCKDAVWTGATCGKGFHCYRRTKYYWQCRDSDFLGPGHNTKDSAIGAYQQCGGDGGACIGTWCKDAPFPGAKCKDKGASCKRISNYWWQCSK